MGEGGMEVGVVTFGDVADAQRLIDSLQQAGAIGKVDELGIIEHDTNGKFSIHSFAPGATRGQHIGMGALVGGLIGTLMGPFGLIAGILGGAGVGASMLSRDPHELEISDAFVASLRDALPNGSSAVLIIGIPETVEQFMGRIRAHGAVSTAELHEPLNEAQVKVLREALEKGGTA